MLDGSHKWPGTQDMRLFKDQNLEEIEQQLSQEGRKVTKVAMTLKKGQMSFHHCWTIHGSQPNDSNSIRLSMAVHLQDEANRYQPFGMPRANRFISSKTAGVGSCQTAIPITVIRTFFRSCGKNEQVALLWLLLRLVL